VASQEETTVVGRVCCEGEGKLNYLSLVLEGSMETSSSARIKLDVQDVKEYRLFPGQIVAARGINTTGSKMQANQIFQVAMPQSSEEVPSNARKPVVWAASGPFTSSGDLEFEALADLLDQCVSSKTDALVLMGPFLGANHALLKQPPSDKTYTQLFQEKIGDLLDQMLDEDDCQTRVILIPSVHDVHHSHSVFPQPPFSKEELGLTSQQARDRVQCFPNPAMFTIGGVTFGTSSCDVIKDLSSEEIASKPQQPGVGPSRIVRIANHLVQQQSFYPLFPARTGSCVDYQSVEKFAMPVKPDVLIVTSDLQRFVEKLDGDVVCCNPGRLVRGAVSGTYLRCAHNKNGSSIDVVRV
jgi:DNA polymerase alpha subunit B